MMPPTIEDVRNYIAIKPVPVWEEATDSKLNARSLHNYTLARPTREEVFKSNYARRLCQMSVQGYCSPAWKPYQEVGKPLYLSSKVMLQSSLGQNSNIEINDKENDEESEDASNEFIGHEKEKSSETDGKGIYAKSSKKPFSNTSTSVKNKQNRNLQDIERDLNAVRENLVKVKMGHALFPMLEEEQNYRNNAFLVEKQNEIRRLKNGMHIHQVTSEEINETNLKSSLYQSTSSKQISVRRASSRASVVSSSSTALFGAETPRMEANKPEVKQTPAERARPFTPVHSNISLGVEMKTSHLSIWRQLCALHWLLEACMLEVKSDSLHQHKIMIPLSECWNELNPGGRTRDSRVVLQERKNNTKWTKFTRTSMHKHGPRNRTRRKNTAYSYHSMGMRRNTSIASDMGSLRKNASIASDLGGLRRHGSVATDLGASMNESGLTGQRSPSLKSTAPNVEVVIGGVEDLPGVKVSRPSSPGQSSVTTTVAGGTVAGSEYGDDESVMDGGEYDKRKDHDEWFHERDYHEHLKKLLSTVKESVSNEMQRRARTALYVSQANNRLPLSVYDWSRSSYFKLGKKEVNISKIVVPASTPVTDYNEPKNMKKPSTLKIRPHTAAVSRRRESSCVTANGTAPSSSTSNAGAKPKLVRPKSSPAKLVTQFNFKFSSEEKKENLGQLREQFDQVNDAKALQLHNKLNELEKRRKQRMEIKFETLQKTSSIHRDLKGMRSAAHAKFIAEKLSKKKRSCMISSDWHNTLMQNLPGDVHSDENCNVILEKLGYMGIQMAEDMQRISSEYFLNALKSLRPWELCSPDVSSAIEFVREFVVQMDAEELDEWRESKLNAKEPIIGSDRKPK